MTTTTKRVTASTATGTTWVTALAAQQQAGREARAATEAKTAAAEARAQCVFEAHGEQFWTALIEACKAAGRDWNTSGGEPTVYVTAGMTKLTDCVAIRAGYGATTVEITRPPELRHLSVRRRQRSSGDGFHVELVADGEVLRARIGDELLDAEGLAKALLEPWLRALLRESGD